MLQFGGLALLPFALLVLARIGDSAQAPAWIGMAAAALAFLLVGAGLHTVQTVGLALATDLAAPESRPKVVGLMYVMLLVGMIASALLFGAMLADFTPGRLVQVIQTCAVLTVVLVGVASWKQEPRRSTPRLPSDAAPDFRTAWSGFLAGDRALNFLIVTGIGTMAFTMEDVLLEPYGGQVLGLAVGETTKLTATLAIGGLIGFGVASRVLARGYDPLRLACIGVVLGIPAFAAVILAQPLASVWLFAAGTAAIGAGAGLFGHSTLTATMNRAPPDQIGLALGAWGASQATAAGLGIVLGGVIRDIVAAVTGDPATGYHAVYALEIVLLVVTLASAAPLLVATRDQAGCDAGDRPDNAGFGQEGKAI